MESVGRSGAPWPLGPRRLLSDDVDRPPYRFSRGDLPGVFEASRVIGGWAHTGPLVCLPGYRLVACHEQYRHLFTQVRRISLWEIPAQLKYLLWDRDAGRIVSFAEHDALQAGREVPAPGQPT